MAKVHKTIEEAGAHLDQSATLIPSRYAEATAKASWADAAGSAAAEANYSAGVTEAIAAGKRPAGIMRVGDTKWKKGCKEKGVAVIGGRIKAAIPFYKAQFGGVLSAMNAAADMAPARTRDPMANIDARLKPVVAAAIAAKVR